MQRLKQLLLFLVALTLLTACSATEDKIKEKINEKAPVVLAENEVEVHFGKEPFIMDGTLAMPEGEGKVPAVVLVPSFGDSDRDLTINENKPFKDIAAALSAEGIAVLRYDKMRFTYPDNAMNLIKDGQFTIYDEVINGAVFALNYLETVDRIDKDKMFAVTYGFSANQSPRIAKQYGKLNGMVLMGGYVSPLQDLMVKQYDYLIHLDGKADAREQEIYDKALNFSQQAAQDTFNEKSILDPIGSMTMPYSYWKDLVRYNPVDELEKLELPLLILQGERDYESDMAEFALWQQGLTNAEFITYPHLNHLFMAGAGDSSPDEYKNKGIVDKKVTADIIAFILSH